MSATIKSAVTIRLTQKQASWLWWMLRGVSDSADDSEAIRFARQIANKIERADDDGRTKTKTPDSVMSSEES